MKKFFSFFICLCFIFQGSAQLNFSNKKRSYKTEGYILNGADSINEWIVVPILNDAIDYYSFTTRVTFIDSSGQQNIYKPNHIDGFGFREDESLGNFISVDKSEGLSKARFLRKILEGKISLLEEILDRSIVGAGYATNALGQPSSKMRTKDIHESIFYVRQNDEAVIKIKFNSKTNKIRKKDLRKDLDFLPDSFANSDEEIDLSDLIGILSELNSKS